MSYNDSYGSGGGYGQDRRDDNRRQEGYGQDRRDDDRRQEGHGGGRQEGCGGGGGGGGYGGEERRHEGGGGYGDRPSGGGYGDDRRQEGGHGGGNYGGGNDRPSGGNSGYGGGDERRNEGGSYGGGRPNDSYNDRPSGGQGYGDNDRPSGGGYGGGSSEGYGQSSSGGYGGNSGNHSGQHSSGTSYGGGGAHGGSSDEYSEAAHHAQQDAGSAGDSNLFSMALGLLAGNKQKLQNEDIDEDDAVKQHQKFYGDQQGSQGQASSNNVGAAAAMQALKLYNGGNQEHAQGGQNKFIGLAMSQAAQLFDQQQSQGKTDPSANKQDAVAQAAQMALKFYLKSEAGGGGAAGGSSGGGLGGLLNIASKFIK